MKKVIQKKDDNKYFINKYQYFYLNKDKIAETFNDIKFPVFVIDTEFFNKSHNVCNLKNINYNDFVYIIKYSYANNFKEIVNRDNTKHIKSLEINRSHNFDRKKLNKIYESVIKKFLNKCINLNIRTMIFAGDANDKKIFEQWINDYKYLLNNKKSDLFIKNPETGLYTINTFDIYSILDTCFAVSNFDNNGDEFYDSNNLKKGFYGDDTLSLPSLKKFFDYMSDVFNSKKFDETKDIYKLCVSALKFYSISKLTITKYIKYLKDIKLARKHCFNDVLKILYLLDFLYSFSCLDDNENKYLKIS